MERVQFWKWMTGHDMVNIFSKKNGMQNVKRVSLNQNTLAVDEIESKIISFSSQNSKTTINYNICLY